MRLFAGTILPPNACATVWCPRHTPRIGTFPANAFTAASETPAESGLPGPGEITSLSGFIAAIPATSILSFLTTFVSTPSPSIAWTRLNVNES